MEPAGCYFDSEEIITTMEHLLGVFKKEGIVCTVRDVSGLNREVATYLSPEEVDYLKGVVEDSKAKVLTVKGVDDLSNFFYEFALSLGPSGIVDDI